MAIGKTPYSTSSTYGSSILSTVKANKSLAGNNNKAMANKGKYSVDELKKAVKTRVLTPDEKSFLNRHLKLKKATLSDNDYKELENSIKKTITNPSAFRDIQDKYKTSKTKLDELTNVDVSEMSDEEVDNITSQIASYKKFTSGVEKIAIEAKGGKYKKSDSVGDPWAEFGNDLSEIDEYLGDFDSMRFDESQSKSATTNWDSVIADYNAIEQNFPEDTNKEQTSMTMEELEDRTADDGTGSTSTSTTTKEVNVDDIGLTGGAESDVDNVPANQDIDYETEIANVESEIAGLEDYNQQAFDDSYAPDYRDEGNLLGTIMDTGRGIMGMIGATEEIPEYQTSSMFNQAMTDATQMRNQGLSDDELAFRERQGEEAFAYDVKNIRRLAGGSGGVALANLGRATGQLYDNKSRTAAEDEAARRANRQNFQGMAMQNENVNRRMFEDDLRQAEMTKQAGSQLVQDALSNIQDRADYNRAYGKGSPYYEYMKEKTLATRRSKFDMANANQRRVDQALRESTQKRDRLIKAMNDKNSISADSTPIVDNQFDEIIPIKGGGTFSRKSVDVNENPYGGSSLTQEDIQLSSDREEQKRLQAEAEADALINGSERKSLFRRKKNKK